MPPHPEIKSLGCGAGKDGRPTVTDLIKPREASLRASEASFRKELAEERRRYEDFRRKETIRTMQTLADKDLVFIQQVEKLREITHSDSEQKPLSGLQENYSPQLTFFDLRSSDSSDMASTPEQHRKIR